MLKMNNLVVRHYFDSLLPNIEQILSGHTASPCASLIQMSACEFVHKNAYHRGQPNLTALQFCEWVNLHKNVSIYEETARRWLHHLSKNFFYFDGHEREDVVQSRQVFLRTLEDLDRTTLVLEGIRPELEDNEKPLSSM